MPLVPSGSLSCSSSLALRLLSPLILQAREQWVWAKRQLPAQVARGHKSPPARPCCLTKGCVLTAFACDYGQGLLDQK